VDLVDVAVRRLARRRLRRRHGRHGFSLSQQRLFEPLNRELVERALERLAARRRRRAIAPSCARLASRCSRALPTPR
jgi:hypothetical protein